MPDQTFDLKQMSFAAAIGIDWADQKHAVVMQTPQGDQPEHRTLLHSPEALEDWALELKQRFDGQPVAIAVELTRGPLIYGLMKYSHLVIFPVPPAKLASYRKAMSNSGAKDDPTDALLILDYLLKHSENLIPWKPDDAKTREMGLLVERRRNFVDRRTALANQLKSDLKSYFPQAIQWLGSKLTNRMVADFLMKWPDLKSLQKAQDIVRFFYLHNVRRPELVDQRIKEIKAARPLTDDSAVISAGILSVQSNARILLSLISIIEKYDKQIKELFAEHEDARLFADLPGGGAALAPRLLVGFGHDRNRYDCAESLCSFAGIAPVTKRSGKQCVVHRRLACPNFLRQTFHEFAKHSKKKSAWARAYYQMQRDRGKGHHAATRALAYKWIRVLYACWKTHTPYNEARYIAQLRHKNSPICGYLKTA